MDNSTFAIVPFVQDNALVIIALALCGVLAALVLVGMAWGAKLKRERKHAEHEETARIDALEAEDVTAPDPDDGKPAATPSPSPAPAPEPQRSQPQPNDSRPAEPQQAPATEDAAPASDPLADEPIAAAAPLDAAPASEAEPSPAPASDNAAETLADAPVTRLKGLGPKVAARLGELGITTVADIAALDDARAAALDDELGAFKGRMARDQWREQARLLAADDRAGYEATYGKLG